MAVEAWDEEGVAAPTASLSVTGLNGYWVSVRHAHLSLVDRCPSSLV